MNRLRPADHPSAGRSASSREARADRERRPFSAESLSRLRGKKTCQSKARSSHQPSRRHSCTTMLAKPLDGSSTCWTLKPRHFTRVQTEAWPSRSSSGERVSCSSRTAHPTVTHGRRWGRPRSLLPRQMLMPSIAFTTARLPSEPRLSDRFTTPGHLRFQRVAISLTYGILEGTYGRSGPSSPALLSGLGERHDYTLVETSARDWSYNTQFLSPDSYRNDAILPECA